jgi:hypothetical protein
MANTVKIEAPKTNEGEYIALLMELESQKHKYKQA